MLQVSGRREPLSVSHYTGLAKRLSFRKLILYPRPRVLDRGVVADVVSSVKTLADLLYYSCFNIAENNPLEPQTWFILNSLLSTEKRRNTKM